MQKRIYILFFLLISITVLKAQNTYSNWINHNQTYVKFKVAEDGVYRIKRNTLTAINNAFITVNPKNIQVFARGKEVPIYVHGENDLSFDSGDYIELYCEKNDAFLDSLMYENPSELNNPYYSQVNDTISYFITWENSPTTKKRFVTYPSDDYASYTTLNSVKEKALFSYNNRFYWGQRVSNYSSGKGWFDADDFVYGQPTKKILNISNRIASSDVEVVFSVCGVPNSDVSSFLNHHLKIKYNTTEMYDATYVGYEGVSDIFRILSSDISNNNLSLEFSSNYNQDNKVDRNTIAYILLKYARDLNFSNSNYANFSIDALSENRSISISDFSGTNPLLYNLGTEERTALIENSNTLNAILHANNLESEVVITTDNATHIVSRVENVYFFDFSTLTEQPDYIMVYNKKLENSVNLYASYRRLQGYKVLQAEISDLYNQFAYGVGKHPIAITNFIDYITENYNQPKYLFLIGKSISSANIRKNTGAYANCLVPTMGNPPSDVLISSILNTDGIEPLIATGRIAARSNNDVEIYLEKVKDYENSSSGIWKKEALFFGGGGYESEQQKFKNYLKEYEAIYSDTLVGGVVSTFLKSTSDPIQISVSDSVAMLINNGVSQMTFFGHGSSSGFDQNIDAPSKYNNYGKYPFITANSCLSGDIHQNTSYQTISEEWVLIKDKGAIGFLAASDLGYPSQLHNLSKEFYKSLSYRKYGKSIGEIVKDGLRYYSKDLPTNSFIRKTTYDNTLHADPAVIINSFEKPDLQIEVSGVHFNPEPITTESDSFDISITYFNVGRAFVDSFQVSVERTFPDGQKDFRTYTQTSCFYSNTLKIRLATDAINAVGVNGIRIRLDYFNEIDELSELNNEVNFQFLIHSDELVPIYPHEFAVVPNAKLTLLASSGNPFDSDFIARFQIDTTDTFDSPMLISQNINTDGGISEWTLPFDLKDSTVYFWRVSKYGSNKWRESSFRYILGQRGWSQAHHFQFKKDQYQFIDYKKEDRRFDFITTPKTLLCKTIGSVPISQLPDVGYWIDGGVGDYGSCGAAPAFNIVVIDSLNLEPWKSDRAAYGHRDYPRCSSRINPDSYFQFTTTDSTAMENLATFIDQIPEGFHVLIYTLWNGNFAKLPENTKLAIENLNPSSQIRTIADNIPYIMYVQKGISGTEIEVIGANTSDKISLNVNLKTNFDYGNIYSTLVGPALEWKSFHWRYRNNIDQKNTQIKILAIDNNGNKEILIDNLTKDSLDIIDLSSRIDAGSYPYLELQMYCRDSILKQVTQIKSWSLLYKEVPETAIEPSEGYVFYKDTVRQGDDIVFAISTKNISPYDMDSLKVSYYIKNEQNKISTIKSIKLRPHPSQDVITDTVSFNTLHNLGKNSIWVEFNGKDSTTGQYDQLEQYHFNNIAVKYFYVEKDNINPLLNVTFDGVHIMDGDIVSPNPDILMRIKDENQYLAMQDPNLVSVFLKSPKSDEEVKIEINDSLNQQQLYWTASTLPDNVAEMLFTPRNLQDGVYTLRVGATDASANESGKLDYRIAFEVINKTTITEILNYPNPFSTSTQFVFTLTGAEIPDEVVIQIMTITGKVVQEIDLTEVSTLHIGRNITDYRWDGRDQYGDLLANGVYFYRVFVKKNGDEVEKSATEADKFFKKGIGKMYIIR